MSASRLFSPPTPGKGPQNAKPEPAWHHHQASLVDIRLPGLESGRIVTADSFQNRLLSLKLYLTERPRPPWLHVSILALAGIAVLCTTLWLLVSLDWPFVSADKAHYVSRRKNASHSGNGTAPLPFEDVRTGPASRTAHTMSTHPTTIEMGSVPSSSDVPPGSTGDETALLTSDMDSVPSSIHVPPGSTDDETTLLTSERDSVPSSSDVPPVSSDDEPTLLTSDIDGADSSFLSSEKALTEGDEGSIRTDG